MSGSLIGSWESKFIAATLEQGKDAAPEKMAERNYELDKL